MDYLEIKALQDQVAEFKRQGQLARAVALLVGWVEREEAENARRNIPVASWPYQQLAVIARKEKRYSDEIAIIERYIQMPRSGSKQSQDVIDRLPKAYQLNGETLDDNHPKLVRRALLIDTETTGLSNQDEVIELAIILLRYSLLSGRILDTEAEYSSLRQPAFKIPPAATAKHGITDKDVRGQRIDEDRVHALLASADILVAHNASYDRRMLVKLFPAVADKPWYCTLNGIDWRGKGCTERRLEYLLSYYDIANTQRHRALDDLRNMLALLSCVDQETQSPFFSELMHSQPVEFASKYDQHTGKAKTPFEQEVIADDYRMVVKMSTGQVAATIRVEKRADVRQSWWKGLLKPFGLAL